MNLTKFVSFGASHATLSEKIFGREDGQIVVRALHTTSDKAGSVLIAYPCKRKTTADGAGATSQAVLPVTATVIEGYTAAANDLVVVCTQTGMFAGIIQSVSAGVSVTLTANLSKTVAPGDEVFFADEADFISIANGAASLDLDYPLCGNYDMPLVLRLDSTSAGNFGGMAEIYRR